MKIYTALAALLLVFVLAVATVAAGENTVVTGATAAIPGESALDPAAPDANGDATIAPLDPAAATAVNAQPFSVNSADRTGAIVGWVIGLAVLAMIIVWAIRSSRSRDYAPTVGPDDPARSNRSTRPGI